MLEWLESCGTALAFLGAALAVALPCSGSGSGVGVVGQAGAGLLSVEPGRFAQVLILQIIPGTQGLYGLVAWFFALMKLGFFGAGGGLAVLSLQEGFKFFGACMPIAIGGWLSAIAQGRTAASGISQVSKRPGDLSKSIIMCIMVEFYAILSLLATFLMLNNLI